VLVYLYEIIVVYVMADKSEYTIEYRVLAAAWYHECDKSISSVRTLKARLRKKFDCKPPDTRYIQKWCEKLFTTGSIIDLHRSGRPNERGDMSTELEESIQADPKKSIRRVLMSCLFSINY
jgi:hypothetical protein